MINELENEMNKFDVVVESTSTGFVAILYRGSEFVGKFFGQTAIDAVAALTSWAETNRVL